MGYPILLRHPVFTASNYDMYGGSVSPVQADKRKGYYVSCVETVSPPSPEAQPR